MWQRLTVQARKAIFISQEEAQRIGGVVTPECLLIGALRVPSSGAERLVIGLGQTAPKVLSVVRANLKKFEAFAQDVTLGPEAKKSIDLAAEIATANGEKHIGSEHLFCGALSHAASRVRTRLARLGVTDAGLVGLLSVSGSVESLDAAYAPAPPAAPTPDSGLPAAMLVHFTQAAREVVAVAQKESKLYGSIPMGPELLTLAVIYDDAWASCQILHSVGVQAEALHAKIRELVAKMPTPETPDQRLDLGGKRVLTTARTIGGGFGHDHIGTEHILLACAMDSANAAVGLLEESGASAEAIRNLVAHRDYFDPLTDQEVQRVMSASWRDALSEAFILRMLLEEREAGEKYLSVAGLAYNRAEAAFFRYLGARTTQPASMTSLLRVAAAEAGAASQPMHIGHVFIASFTFPESCICRALRALGCTERSLRSAYRCA